MATVDVQSMVTRWGEPQAMADAGAASPPSQAAAGPNKDVVRQKTAVDSAVSGPCPGQLLNMPAQQFATTVRVPLGTPVVLGGMSFAPAGPAGMEKTTDNATQLYLIVTTSIATDVSQ